MKGQDMNIQQQLETVNQWIDEVYWFNCERDARQYLASILEAGHASNTEWYYRETV